MTNYQEIWNKTLSILKDNIEETQYKTWISQIIPLSCDSEFFDIQVPSDFFKEYIDEHYVDIICSALQKSCGVPLDIKYHIVIDPNMGNKGTTIQNSQRPIELNNPSPSESSTQPFCTNLNPRYRMKNFIEGTSNKLARTAGINIINNPGGVFNPFFIYGDSTVGKTHLANAIGLGIKERYPEKKVLYVSANDFMIQYGDSIKNQHTNDFLKFYQSVDILILDDVQDLEGKEKTLNTFFHIFNQLHQMGRQLIMCCDRDPSELKMSDRIITRFKWGLNAKIDKPELELRKKILKSKASDYGMEITDDIVDYIAENITNNRALEGTLMSMLANASILNTEININLAKKIINNGEHKKAAPTPVSLEQIYDLVCDNYAITKNELVSKSRKSLISEARQVAIYLARKHTNNSLIEIGKSLGNRNHATIVYAQKTINDLMATNINLKKRIKQLECEINNI